MEIIKCNDGSIFLDKTNYANKLLCKLNLVD